MSSHVEILHSPIIASAASTAADQVAAPVHVQEEHSRFAYAQVERLVHQLFFSASIKLPRQVVFSAIDEEVDVGGICTNVAETLAARVPGSVGVIAANAWSRDVRSCSFGSRRTEALRDVSEKVAPNLWSVAGPVFWGKSPSSGSPAWVRERLSELRGEFDYSIIHAPAASLYSGTALLGQASDGIVLIIEANYTRRATALKTKEMLHAANVRLLGTILSGRTFPIPEGVYKRL